MFVYLSQCLCIHPDTIARNIEYSYARWIPVPRYRKVATPASRSTFHDRHTKQFSNPYYGKRPQLHFHESIKQPIALF
jgi:hypothetical protein